MTTEVALFKFTKAKGRQLTLYASFFPGKPLANQSLSRRTGSGHNENEKALENEVISCVKYCTCAVS